MSRAWFVILAASALSACIGGTEPGDPIDFGSVGLDINSDGSGGYTASPLGYFTRGFLASQPTTIPANRCLVLGFSPVQVIPDGIVYTDPGSPVQVTVGATTVTLVQTQQQSGLRAYTAPSFAVTPGDMATLTVPGAAGGFPQTSATVRTAEPFTASPVPVVEDPPGIPLQWTTPEAPIVGQIMVVSLRYAAAGGTQLDRQILCELTDNGTYTVPADVGTGWGDPGVQIRSVVFQRVRRQVVPLGENILEFGSTYDVIGATFVPTTTSVAR
ncbi:MAG TPA: hypothetical protein VNA89_06505 [Gemmatimonadaceae bacterium]|nr:hypothetical protein [Gemmatimonadaceae bacterium]